MCLISIDKKKPKPEGVGYKVIQRESLNRNEILTPFDRHISRGKWIVANQYGEYTEASDFYLTGFHILTRPVSQKALDTEWDKDHVTTIKVKYRGARLRGKDNTILYDSPRMTVVADEIYIPKPGESL